MADKAKANIAINFLEQGMDELPSADWMSRSDVYYDLRNNMFSQNCDFTTWQWYYNYLISNARFADRNPQAYPSYLLKLGYIPIVFLPTCCSNYAVTMMNKLDQMNIPYIRTAAYSFVVQRPVTDMLDAWVNKLDIERIFDIPLTQIRSVTVAERIYG